MVTFITFTAFQDSYLLRKPVGAKGLGGFDKIGTDEEAEPLTLKNLMSYDEMQVSALVGIAGPCLFFNAGARESELCCFI
jgi:hypothetical protein